MPLRSIGNIVNRRVIAPNVNFEIHSSVEICLYYGGIFLRRRQGFDYIGGDSVMICDVNVYEFFYDQLLLWVVENVNCPDVGVVCYRVPDPAGRDLNGFALGFDLVKFDVMMSFE
ncbi:hypothetical protein Tco_1008349 [Tanacetum coccineum]